MKEKISVIVPVYNTIRYLKTCLNSILQQTYLNIEIILVDDGSTDGSDKICDEYAEKNDRIRVIHKENKGVVAARKQGVRAAEGNYIAFVDSDDYIEPNMFERLGELAEKTGADIVTSGCRLEYSEKEAGVKIAGSVIRDGFPEGFFGIEKKSFVCENMMHMDGYSTKGILTYLCTKLFKRKLLEDNMSRVPEKITCSEDACLVYMCCMDAESIYVSHEVFYHYYVRETSCVHTPDRKWFGVLDQCYDCLNQKVMEMDLYRDALIQQLERFIAVRALWGLNNRFGFSNGGVLPLYMVSVKGWNIHTKIVLYGAGMVGRSYYQQITAMEQANIVLWIDGDDRVVENNVLLKPVNTILDATYDYILIAVKRKEQGDIIRNDLLKMGIEREKIVWKEPQYMLDVFAN